MEGTGAEVRDHASSGEKLPAMEAAQSARGLKLRVTWQMRDGNRGQALRTGEARREREEKWEDVRVEDAIFSWSVIMRTTIAPALMREEAIFADSRAPIHSKREASQSSGDVRVW